MITKPCQLSRNSCKSPIRNYTMSAITPFYPIHATYHIFRDGIRVDRVVVGDLRLSSSSEYHLSISPQEIIAFPGFDPYTLDGDIALIKLSQRLPFSPFVRPVCLVEPSVDEAQDFSRCMISGWGDTETGGIYFQRIFQRDGSEVFLSHV